MKALVPVPHPARTSFAQSYDNAKKVAVDWLNADLDKFHSNAVLDPAAAAKATRIHNWVNCVAYTIAAVSYEVPGACVLAGVAGTKGVAAVAVALTGCAAALVGKPAYGSGLWQVAGTLSRASVEMAGFAALRLIPSIGPLACFGMALKNYAEVDSRFESNRW